MSWNQNLTNLNYILAGNYPFKNDALPVARKAGLNILNIGFNDKPVTNWFNIIDQAEKENKVQALIENALVDFPNDPGLRAALEGALTGIAPILLDAPGEWRDADPDGPGGYEKIIGKESTLLDIAYLETGLIRSRSVARVVLPDGSAGSGFLVDDNIFITNNHVINTEKLAAECRAQFNYQRNPDGLALKMTEFAFDPAEGFATSPMEKHDWTALKIKGDANAHWGALSLKPNKTEMNKRVTIIQHPNGLHKQIALYHNFVRYVDENIVQYLTDTLPGSSGSPVFDDQWNLIALHHSGGNIREPATKRIVFRNEGIHINKVIEGMKEAGIM
jgi:V8-like Glu-specific endopeptidase